MSRPLVPDDQKRKDSGPARTWNFSPDELYEIAASGKGTNEAAIALGVTYFTINRVMKLPAYKAAWEAGELAAAEAHITGLHDMGKSQDIQPRDRINASRTYLQYNMTMRRKLTSAHLEALAAFESAKLIEELNTDDLGRFDDLLPIEAEIEVQQATE